MGKPKAPPAPDYAGAAQAQGEANLKSTLAGAGLARPDEITPTGSRTWQLRPGADPKNPQPGDYIATTTLSPEQQGLYNQSTDLSKGLLDTAQGGLSRVDQMMGTPLDLSSAGAIRRAPGTPDLTTSLDFSGAPGMPTDAAATRDKVTQAIIGRSMPELDRAAEAARTRSIVAGSDVGSSGFDRTEMANERARNDLILGAVTRGGDAATQEIANQLALRQQGTGEAVQKAGFGNQALGQQFGQAMQATGVDNATRTQLIQELLAQRQLPLNEINALRSGTQVNLPQFTAGGNVGTPQAPPIFNAAQAQSQFDQGIYGNDVAGYNASLSSGANLAALYALLAMGSDIRLKTNIRPTVRSPRGVQFYTWDWNDEAKRIGFDHYPTWGVLAQEHPEASRVHPSGYLMVNLALVGSAA